MISTKKFHVNEYITLKLENEHTNIYVNGEYFNQCKFLLLNIPVEKISSFDEIDSIDEAAEKLDKKLHPILSEDEILHRIKTIPPETEFWGHCSNIQVWAENNYDTRLLHSNLAFPLLKKLTEVGDIVARRIFKEEIARRINSGYLPIIWFLRDGDYFDFLSHEEQLMALLHPEEANALFEIEHHSGTQLEFTESWDLLDDKGFLAENKRITELSLSNCGLNTLPDSIGNFSLLRVLNLEKNKLTNLPDSIGNLKNLETLYLNENKLARLPESIGNLTSLRKLILNDNTLEFLPDSIGNLSSLKIISLEGNQLIILPDFVKRLRSLIERKSSKSRTYL